MRIKGFTLIEVITVVGVMAIAFPTFFAVVIGVLRQQARIVTLQEAKSQGDRLLSTIDNLVRNNAVAIYNASSPLDDTTEVCSSVAAPTYPTTGARNGANMYFRDKFNNTFRIYEQDGKIASDSSIFAADASLTSSPIVISNFEISCEIRDDLSTSIVSVKYQVGNSTAVDRPEETVSLNYQTKIKLRAIQ